MIAVYCVGSVAALFLAGVIWFLTKLSFTNRRVERELDGTIIERFKDPGTVRDLTVLPLVEFYAENSDYKTEAGVSYLIKADGHSILLDTGYNEKESHPSPLIHNTRSLSKSTKV